MYVGCEQISVHASGGEPLGICERSSSSRCKPGTSSSRRLRVGRGEVVGEVQGNASEGAVTDEFEWGVILESCVWGSSSGCSRVG